MVSASTRMAGSRRLFALVASLALSACGSADSVPSGRVVTNANTQPAPSGYVYVVSSGADPSSAGAIYEYNLFSDSVAPMSQASIATGAYPAAVASAQGHVYVVNVGDGTISQYDAAPDGTLTPMNPATVTNPGMHTLGAALASALIDGTGSFLYVTNSMDNTLSQFNIGSDGRLTPLTPSTVATGVDPVAIAAVNIVDNPSGYYVVNSGAPGDTGTVSLYSSGVNGARSLLNADTVAAGTNPSAIAVNDVSSTAYVVSNCDGAQCMGSVRQFAVGTSGALTGTGAIETTGSHYEAVNVVIGQDDNTDQGIYVLSNATAAGSDAGALWQYGIASTGQLTPASPSMINTGSVAVGQVTSFDRPGALYVLTANSGEDASTGGSINFYSLAAGGAATQIATAKISAPRPVAFGMVFLLAP